MNLPLYITSDEIIPEKAVALEGIELWFMYSELLLHHQRYPREQNKLLMHQNWHKIVAWQMKLVLSRRVAVTCIFSVSHFKDTLTSTDLFEAARLQCTKASVYNSCVKNRQLNVFGLNWWDQSFHFPLCFHLLHLFKIKMWLSYKIHRRRKKNTKQTKKQ